MLLATVGAIAGFALAAVGVRLLLVLGASRSFHRLETVPFDSRVLLFAVVVLVISGLAMGIPPAWRLASTISRPSSTKGDAARAEVAPPRG